MRKPLLILLALGGSALAQEAEIRLVRVANGLTNPLGIESARDGSGRLFLVQQNGLIRLLRDGQLAGTPFLDIRTRTRASGECGLLGLAFPPGFADRRRFYVNYTNSDCTISTIARYRLSANADVADATSEEIILQQRQPFENHNGGRLAFGPDGYLYAGFGDGGSGGDPQNNGQNLGAWLGKILRFDPESGTAPYAIPPTNPFVNDARARPEIWAYGLRNPWRFSFDRETGDLWIADVGQNRAEEINLQPASSKGGENYGWRLMEGLSCYNPSNCDRSGLTLPVLEYTRERGDVSVTGGFVYRGTRWPSLRSAYVYGDYASGRIWGIRRAGTLFNNSLLLDTNLTISSFGEDEAGELYVAGHGSGEVFRIEATETPRFTSGSVANAASFEAGVTPGSAAVVFVSGVRALAGITAAQAVPLPRQLDGVRVSVNGRDAPLYAVANVNGQEQVNFQVPWETEPSTARVIVTRDTTASPAVDVRVQALQPGVFENGAEAIVVRTAGNTLVTAQRPLGGGETAYLYATGLGGVEANPGTGNGGPRDASARTRNPVTITIDGVDCEVLFAGLAPDFVGIYQVNFRAPASNRGGQRELVVSAGGVRSRAVRISVQ
jgi:uncharacterized protein (TIGR03437 family)